MSQQPYGQPPQQGYGAPPEWAGQQQGPPQQAWPGTNPNQAQQPAQGWGPPQQQGPGAPAMQAAVDPTAVSGGFFGGMSGGGSGTPSFKWAGKGDIVQGVVVSADVIDITDYTTKLVVTDEKTGQAARQLAITLQTALRNWDRVSKVPVDENGNQLPPDQDDGKRSIYTGGRRTDGTSWMSGAIKNAMAAAGRDPAQGLEVGAMLGVFVEDLVDSGKGNPYRTYQAKYVPPGQHQGLAPTQQAQQAPPQQQAPQAPPQQQAQQAAPPQAGQGWDGYQGPPQGQGLPPAPQANPFAQQAPPGQQAGPAF